MCLKKMGFFGRGREYNVCVNILSVCMSGPDTLKGQKRVIDPLELDVVTDVVSHCIGAENQNQVL